jgi:4-diphosphocytidyl-2-C-methyl-D-erythritol kinase
MPTAPGDSVSAQIFEVASKVESARAKINLALHVTGRRADGYHLLDSLVVFADVADTLKAVRQEESLVKLTLDGQFADELADAGATRDNLVIRAADELMASFPGRHIRGVRLTLTKRLPVASGIGGGSADAAATLRLLDRLWRFGTSREKLAEIGLRVGADVPACLASRPLKAEGIGDRILLATGIPELPLILVNPGIALATRDVFRRLQSSDGTGMWPVPPRFNSLIEFAQWLRLSRNDLFDPAKAQAAIVGTVVKAVSSDPECLIARMSGSGATVFGIFNSHAAAARAAARIHAAKPGWWVAVTRSSGS